MAVERTSGATDGEQPPRRSIGALARRAGWNVVDQGLSSLSNLALSVLVARAVDSEAFGAFSVSFTVYSVAVLVSRSLASQPMAMRFTRVSAGEFRRAAGRSTGTAAVVGLVLGVVVLVSGLALGGGVGIALVAMALLLPGLLVQDAWRLAFFAEGRPEQAALLDAVWMVLQIGGVSVLLATGADDALPFVVAWGLAALAAAVLGARQGRVPPLVHEARRWLTDHWDLTRYLVVESLLLQGAYQGALLLVSALGSLGDIGALRGAQVALGPISLLAASALAFAVPEVSRRPGLTTRQRLVVAGGIGGVLSLGGLVWGLVMLALPTPWGEALFGDTWSGIRTVLVASLVGQVGNLLSVGPACIVYGMGRAKAVFRIHAAISAMLVVFGVGGLLLGGAPGAAYGFALAYWLGVPAWYRCVVKVGREADAAAEADAEAAASEDSRAEDVASG